MSPEELIQRCKCRENPAWDEFIRRYKGLVARSVRYKLAKLNAHIARNSSEDIVQDVFFSIWDKDKLTGLKDIECLESWLVMLSINAAANYCRDREIRQAENTLSLDEPAHPGEDSPTLGEVLPSASFNTNDLIVSGETSFMLEQEMAALDWREQLALKLNIFDGKKQREIADIMALPEGTVATLIRRAKERLRERLKPFMDPDRTDIKK